MTITQQRELLKSAYLSTSWTQKVNKMSDQQVIAIFFRLKAQGKI
jgi:hypothetical protein